jgi:hypothetical protein
LVVETGHAMARAKPESDEQLTSLFERLGAFGDAGVFGKAILVSVEAISYAGARRHLVVKELTEHETIGKPYARSLIKLEGAVIDLDRALSAYLECAEALGRRVEAFSKTVDFNAARFATALTAQKGLARARLQQDGVLAESLSGSNDAYAKVAEALTHHDSAEFDATNADRSVESAFLTNREVLTDLWIMAELLW